MAIHQPIAMLCFGGLAIFWSSVAADAATLKDRAALLAAEALGASKAEAQFSDPSSAAQLEVRYGADARIAILSLDKVSGRFELLVRPALDDAARPPLILSGNAVPIATVAVLLADKRAGEIITAADVGDKDFARARISATHLRKAHDLIGMTPRRALSAHQPINAADLKRPAVIAKGAMVTMRVTMPGLELSVAGQAMAEGALGETIPVINTQSRRTVSAVIAGPGLVEVQLNAPALPAIAQAGPSPATETSLLSQ